MFSYNDEPAVVFVENGKELMRFSTDKEEDTHHTEWVGMMREAGRSVTLEDMKTGWTFYTSEDGTYEDNKNKISKVIEGFGYDAP
jgi:hypothetical protein